MAWQRPTLSELVDRIQSDLVSRLELTGAILRRAIVYVMARVWAGAAHMMHGHLEHQTKQILPDTADAPQLARWGRLFSIQQTQATYAAGNVVVTGSNHFVVDAGSLLQRTDGALFSVTVGGTISGGSGTLAVKALVAGQEGNTDAAVTLSFQSPITGANSDATVDTGGLVGGTDQEELEDYRARVLDRLAEPPAGGSETDYRAWAKAVAGVTRAWVYPQELGAGTVTVRFVRDNDASIIPDAGEVAAVQSYIDARRPVTATVTVVAPVAVPLNFTIALTPNTTAAKAAVQAELEDLLRRIAEPAATIPISQMEVAIGVAADVTDFILSVPAADVTHGAGQIATMGTITWL